MKTIVVGISDMKVSNNPDEVLITYSLGSCLGVIIYDPVARVAGMLHSMLPLSKIDPHKATASPYMFVDPAYPCYSGRPTAWGPSRKIPLLRQWAALPFWMKKVFSK